ncbi:hypothetical protein MOV61_00065 [Neorhizobium sp. BETTINA12A]|nr:MULTISPECIES: hypothetical protein [Neorhizobium]MCJ9749109.1 hypothetical protein [Neorhizobium sp. BETTINA12A]
MRRFVENDPASGFIRQPATIKMAWQHACIDNAREKRLADRAALDKRGHLAIDRRAAQVVVDAQDDSRAPAALDHLGGFLEARRKRLFAQDMFAGGGCCKHMRMVQPVDARNINRIAVVKELAQIRRASGYAEGVGKRIGPPTVGRIDRGDMTTI